jgi:porin
MIWNSLLISKGAGEMKTTINIRYLPLAMFCLALLAGPAPAFAQPVQIPPTWGGDFLSRPRLTDSWLGLRDDLGKKGVVFDVDLLLTPQGVATGGRDTGAEFWGNADYTLSVDTEKLGLWPGGFLHVWADTGFGHNVFTNSAAIVPVNTAALIPAPNDQTTALMNATFMQFLSAKFGLIAGKISPLDSSTGEFYGDYRTQFMNTGLAYPMTLATVPLSAYGGGVIVLPSKNLTLSVTALDPNGTPTNNSLNDVFDNGVLVVTSAEARIHPFELAGHQTLGFTWSNKERFSLIQDPANLARALLTQQFPRLANPGPILDRILMRFFPALLVPVQPPNMKSSTWSMWYSFHQYLWQPDGDSKRGIGVFFTFGASDGNPNPIQYFYSLGVGGNGVLPRRPKDNFGIGWAGTQFSDDFVPLLRQKLDLGLNLENAIELYYNAAMTPWLNATLDLQIVNSALKRTLDSSGHLSGVNTDLVAGIRLQVRF